MTTDRYIGVNADAGETFGRWRLGNDGELFCTSFRSKTRAATTPVTPGLSDLFGFGRRALAQHRQRHGRLIIYEGGARLAGRRPGPRSQVKPHSAMPAARYTTPERAVAVARALQTVRPGILLMPAPRPLGYRPVVQAGLPAARAPQLVSREEPGRCRRPRPPGLE
ncbi:LamB/YcsF family protein [Streptomyces sp. NPDC006332]|uniref:LamB/YcsF family protein n=1 Tax=Streptomyces sp. NPDC006332 TaxID=3155456 RepID=UPI0033BE9881